MRNVFTTVLILATSFVGLASAKAALDCRLISHQKKAEALISAFRLGVPATWAEPYVADERQRRQEIMKQIGEYSVVNPQPEFTPGYTYVSLRFRNKQHDEGVMSGVVFCSPDHLTLRVVAGNYSFPALYEFGDLSTWSFPFEHP